MNYWKKERLKEIMKHIIVVMLIVAVLHWNCSWDKEVL